MESAPRPSDETEHFAFIDALRGWAFLAVMAVHVHVPASVPKWLQQLPVSGNYGVQLFFVISALTLCMSYDARRTRDRRPIAAFFLRRLLRIAPLFWLAIPFYLWHNGVGPKESAPAGIHWPQIVSTAFFLHGWYPTSINSVVPGGWSIAVEMNFYLLLPVCFALLTSLRKSILACTLALGLAVGLSFLANRWLMTFYPADQTGLIRGFLYYWLPRQMPVFLLGFILHFLIQRFRRRPGTAPGDPTPKGSGTLFTAVAVGGLLLLVGVGHRLLLTSSPGVRSHIERHPVAGLLVAYGACLTGTLALSTLTHSQIELRGQHLGKWLINRFEWGRPVLPSVQEIPIGNSGAGARQT